jgi:hypothetical protein
MTPQIDATLFGLYHVCPGNRIAKHLRQNKAWRLEWARIEPSFQRVKLQTLIFQPLHDRQGHQLIIKAQASAAPGIWLHAIAKS